MMSTQVTLEQMVSALDDSYELVYVDYRDSLTDEQTACLVRGDTDAIYESVWEFESDSQYSGARYVADELLSAHGIDRDDFDGYDELLEAIMERDSSDVVGQLVKLTPAQLLRINVLNEDNAYAYEDVSPERVLADVGLTATEDNVRTVQAALNECSPEYSVLLAYWIVGADVSELADLPSDPDATVRIQDPYLYLGNPFAGSGFITERALQGVVKVKRGDLRTDRDAFGYAVDEVYGGLSASQFACGISAEEAI